MNLILSKRFTITDLKATPVFLLFVFGLSINQSIVVFGINLSISDIFLVITIIILVLSRRLYLHTLSIVFFIILVILSAVGLMYSSTMFNINPTLLSEIREYAKILVLFLYFTLGFCLREQEITEITRGIVYGSVVIAIFGILGLSFKIELLNSILSRDGFRLSGLLNDPNYFSIMQIISMFILFYQKDKSFKPIYLLSYIILFYSIVLSGSKTGIITLIIMLFLVYSKSFSKGLIRIISILLVSLFAFVVFTELVNEISAILVKLSLHIPQLRRITDIFIDFYQTLAFSESGRVSSWNVALNIASFSPIVGVGFGSYQLIGISLFGYSAIAHNTYLQLAAEWGIPLTVMFFGYLAWVLFRSSRYHSDKNVEYIRICVYVLLIGSLAISLNNIRIFWLLFGYLTARISKKKNEVIA
jgi:O-antigen ligase